MPSNVATVLLARVVSAVDCLPVGWPIAFAWWRLSLSVSVCLASFPSLDTLRRYAHGVTRFTSARFLEPSGG